MKSPTITTYLLGNLVVLFGSWIVTAIAVFGWVSGQGSFLTAAICFILACWSLQCSDRITKFNRWQREWNGLSEAAAPPGIRFPPIPGLNLLALFFGWPVLLLLHFTRRAGKERAPVRVCAGRPWASPDLGRAYAALPDYCARLAQPRPGART